MKQNKGFVLQNVGGEWLLVPIGIKVINMNGLISLNDSAAYIWNLLVEDLTADEVVNIVAENYDMDIARVRGDLVFFLNEIKHMGILE
jgi:hypothetical protein